MITIRVPPHKKPKKAEKAVDSVVFGRLDKAVKSIRAAWYTRVDRDPDTPTSSGDAWKLTRSGALKYEIGNPVTYARYVRPSRGSRPLIETLAEPAIEQASRDIVMELSDNTLTEIIVSEILSAFGD